MISELDDIDITDNFLHQAKEERQISLGDQHPNPYYAENIYEGHTCNEIDELTEKVVSEMNDMYKINS